MNSFIFAHISSIFGARDAIWPGRSPTSKTPCCPRESPCSNGAVPCRPVASPAVSGAIPRSNRASEARNAEGPAFPRASQARNRARVRFPLQRERNSRRLDLAPDEGAQAPCAAKKGHGVMKRNRRFSRAKRGFCKAGACLLRMVRSPGGLPPGTLRVNAAVVGQQ